MGYHLCSASKRGVRATALSWVGSRRLAMMLDLETFTVGELRELDQIARETCGLEMTACIGNTIKLEAEKR